MRERPRDVALINSGPKKGAMETGSQLQFPNVGLEGLFQANHGVNHRVLDARPL